MTKCNTKNLMRKYYDEIDSLRAMAVIAVIINHVDENWLLGGYLGVDLFFVISGFVVTASLSSDRSDSFFEFISNFYKKRIKRLYPALVICVLLFSLLAFFISPSPTQYIRTGFFALLASSNIFLSVISFNYFTEAASVNPFTHTWSLGVEEQFYILYPLVFWFFKDAKTRCWFLAFSFIFSLIFFIYIKKINNELAFYLMPSRLWQLALGGMVYQSTSTQLFSKLNKHIILLPLVGLVHFFLTAHAFEGIPTFLVTLLTAFCLILIKESKETRAYLTWRPILLIGLASYSLYLYHWPVLVLFKQTVSLSLNSLTGCLLVLMILTFFSYRIETVQRRKKWNKWHVYMLSFLLCLMFFATYQSKAISDQFFAGNPGQKHGGYTLAEKAIAKYKQCYYESTDPKGVWGYQSDFDQQYSRCNLMSYHSTQSIFSYGNSHLSSLVPSLYEIAHQKKFNLFFYARGGLEIYPYESVFKGAKTKVPSLMLALFFDHLQNNVKSGDIVVISTPLYHFTKDKRYFYSPSGKNKISAQEALNLLVHYLQIKAEKLQSMGVQFYFVAGFPILESEIRPQICYQPWSKYNQRCSIENTLRIEQNAEIEQLSRSLESALGQNYIGLYDEINKHVSHSNHFYRLYYNDDHLSVYGNRYIVDYMSKELKKIPGHVTEP